jgi:hypothetical protein
MSPQQASGHPVDFRSDQFSLGALFYEVVTGLQTFKRATVAQTLAAIIEDDPQPVAEANPKTPTPLRWIIERCLAKDPEDRYAATRDLVRDLATLRAHLSELSSGARIGVEEPRRRRRRWQAAAVGAAVLLGMVGMLFLGRRLESATATQPHFASSPSRRRHRHRPVRPGRPDDRLFLPDRGQTARAALHAARQPEVRPLGLPPAQILSISRDGEMALPLSRPHALLPRIAHMVEQVRADPHLLEGTLAQARSRGSAARAARRRDSPIGCRTAPHSPRSTASEIAAGSSFQSKGRL